MYRGVLTGLNEAFVIDQGKRDELITADPKSAELIKPWLRGQDIKRWKADWAGLYVIFTRRGIDIESYPAIKAHLEQWKVHLTPKLKSNKNGPGRKPGSYKWYEIQDNIAYYQEFDQPKVIWPDIAPSPRMAWDETGAFVGNTAYILPGHAWLVAVLNSRILQACLGLITTRIRGGYYRFIDSNVSPLPIILPSTEIKLRLEELSYIARNTNNSIQSVEEEINELVEQICSVSNTEKGILNEWFEKQQVIANEMDEHGQK